VVRHLGFTQAENGQRQGDCVVVQAMIPEGVDTERLAKDAFAAQVEAIFRDNYLAKDRTEDELWSLGDLDSDVAPHRPVAITYRQRLAFFGSVDEVAEDLVYHHRELSVRLDERIDR
jgi:hypothetical protein